MRPRPARWPYAVLLAQVLVFFRAVLFSREYTIPWDFRYYHYPLAAIMARAFAGGEFPLWDASTYCGRPFYAVLQAQAFYPPTLAAALFSNLAGGRHLLAFLEWQLALHVLLAGIFTYRLLRGLGAGAAPSLVGAAVYQLGAYFASQAQHLGAVNAAAWMPLAWHAVLLLGRGFAWRRIALLAGALALSFLAGFTPATMVVFASTALLALAVAALRAAPARVLLYAAAGAALALLLSAVQLLPALELTGLSVASLRHQWGHGSGIPLPALATLVWPNRLGALDFHSQGWRLPWSPTFTYLYCGIPALLFALAALARRRERMTAAFALLAALFAFWMLGTSTPVGRFLYPLLPGPLRASFYAEFGLAAFVLALAVLAGLGAEAWLGGRRRLVQAAVVALAVADLIFFNAGHPFNTASKSAEMGVTYDQMDAIAEGPPLLRRLTARSLPPSRIDNMDGSPPWTGCAPLFDVPSANGDDPFALIRFLRVRLLFSEGDPWSRYYPVTRPDSPILDLLNVSHVVAHQREAPPGLAREADLKPLVIHANPDALPRFFLAGRTHRAGGMEEALARMGRPDFNPRAEAVVEGPAAPELDGGAEGTVQVLRYTGREILLRTEASAPALLVTSEAWYPGWRAWIDGRERPLLLTNAAFRGLEVPAGNHAVRMRFEPPRLWPAAFLSAGTLAALAALILLRDNKRAKGPWNSPSRSSLP